MYREMPSSLLPEGGGNSSPAHRVDHSPLSFSCREGIAWWTFRKVDGKWAQCSCALGEGTYDLV